MIDRQCMNAYGEAPVLSAQDSSRRWYWVIGLLVLALVTYLKTIFLVLTVNVGAYVGLIGATLVLVLALDLIFTDRTIFYQDRIVKIWHFLGQRTIYYSRAKVAGPNPREARLKKWYQITEIKDNGGRIWLQIAILYGAHLVSADTAQQTDLIIAYLTGNDENRVRLFKKRFLPAEVVRRIDGNSPTKIP